MSFKLTYSTMFNPPEEMHTRFDAAVARTRAALGVRHKLFIGGQDVEGAGAIEKTSPIDGALLGHFGAADAGQVAAAVAAARRAFPAWRATPLAERVRLSKRVAALIEERVYDIAAALCIEVGKNRLEALAEAAETADFFKGYAEDFAANGGFDRTLPDDPLSDYRSHNRSVLKPYGVWVVVSPFNFPLALAGGPTAAALVTGNTLVVKGASDTPWAIRLLADCIRDAGFPPGVFNFVAGAGSTIGEALVSHPDVAGITFTGSHEVGMALARRMVTGAYTRPCVTEMGGKNAVIVTAAADLERAATGIVRSAFGLSGQKCSATSRVYVATEVADALTAKLVEKTQAIRIGDPTVREHWLGPVISTGAVAKYLRYASELTTGGRILTGGKRLTDGALGAGCFVAPTVAEAPHDHPLYGVEMFLPIVMVGRVGGLEDGIARANDSPLGLTAGFYGSVAESKYFLDHIEAGTVYVNRPQGATTGAWPWYQAFGGWKGSASTGKAIGSFYYLPLYLREQSQTVVE
ncbi:MAG TPA: aldehyde dehydrogenase family protein [Steroidobacteraceae bacterium]|nr:aldehyde dehydrogenase family protein [Steroidobacteraceae bacterium]